MKLDPDQSLLMIVDVQERLAPAIHGGDEVVAACGTLIAAATRLEIPILVSEQYPKGLGATVESLRRRVAPASVLDKVHFSCLGDEEIRARIEAAGRRQIVLAGMEAHVCVLQTGLDLAAGGWSVAVVADAVGSRNPAHKALGIDRLVAAGAAAVCVEMVLFEWLVTGQHPAFKDVQALIK